MIDLFILSSRAGGPATIIKKLKLNRQGALVPGWELTLGGSLTKNPTRAVIGSQI